MIENNRPPAGEDGDLRAALAALDPSARDKLRRVLIRDQANRDAVSSQLLRYRDETGDDWADIIDFLTMHSESEAARGAGTRGDRRETEGSRRRVVVTATETPRHR